MRKYVILAGLAITGCTAEPDDNDPAKGLVEFVDAHQKGHDTDHWVEMKNMSGNWEKTVLVFGYLGD